MSNTDRNYRIRTEIGKDTVVNVNLSQTYDQLEILSLKLGVKDAYKTYESDYGVVVGRVVANGGFGVPNAKISVFIPTDEATISGMNAYRYTSPRDSDVDGIRYNLLPSDSSDECHQDVGTFPSKRGLLDGSKSLRERFGKYWRYTTTTNKSGDYMIFGVPTGAQRLHMDLDLSDCGLLSQKPRDMIAKGYNANLFDSPVKFKSGTDLESLVHIISQDQSVTVYPFWGEETQSERTIAITRCDFSVTYEFEPTCVFMGSIITDSGNNAIGKNCDVTESAGRMSDMTTGSGRIEMIRKTPSGLVEQFQIKGDELIDGDGVWCYSIPMNLDYVTTDEFGDLVPTDDPSKGIPTRAKVRFRITMPDTEGDQTARKRCAYLVPNFPKLNDDDSSPVFNSGATLDADYEFGTNTRDESYVDLFWNKVYTVKNYIPRLQTSTNSKRAKHTGIKLIDTAEAGTNQFPYNSMTINLNFQYRFICVLTKIVIKLIGSINGVISALSAPLCWLANLPILWIKPFGFLMYLLPPCIKLSSDFCDDGINPNVYYPGCGIGASKWARCLWANKVLPDCEEEQLNEDPENQKSCTNDSGELYTCVEQELAQANNAVSFEFDNDWVNGVLYMPRWYRKITRKKSFLFGLFKRKAKDEWCTANQTFSNLRLYKNCAVSRSASGGSHLNFKGESVVVRRMGGQSPCGEGNNEGCHDSFVALKGNKGIVVDRETMAGQTVYYYSALERKGKDSMRLLFATDIVLLGSLNDCDRDGVPQFYRYLEPTTYNMPERILFTEHEFKVEFDSKGKPITRTHTATTEMTGCDWGNTNEYGVENEDSGLFYSIGCSSIRVVPKSCINLQRICEMGVSLDETRHITNAVDLFNGKDEDVDSSRLVADGFISFDEVYNTDARAMFATMNGNRLKTRKNEETGFLEYDLRYLFPHNFDGSLKSAMQKAQSSAKAEVSYRKNYNLETVSFDYYLFRMGNNPTFYSGSLESKADNTDNAFPVYENSFYFYFGLKGGKTAIEKFNSLYSGSCGVEDGELSPMLVTFEGNHWCEDGDPQTRDGYISLQITGISVPYTLTIQGDNLAKDQSDVTSLSQDNCKSETVYIKGPKCTQELGGTELKGIPMPPNGDYQLTVKDADGVEYRYQLSLHDEYLEFDIESYNFDEPWASINMSPAEIANDTTGIGVAPDIYVRDIGGEIIVRDITVEPPFVLEMEMASSATDEYTYIPKVLVLETDKGGYEIKISNSVDEQYEPWRQGGGSPLLEVWFEKSQVAGKERPARFAFGVPFSEKNYRVKVTQACGSSPQISGNTCSKMVSITEPTPFKLYINDVDYDMIHKLQCGWNKAECPVTGNYAASEAPKGESLKQANGWYEAGKEELLVDANNIFAFRCNDLGGKILKAYRYDTTVTNTGLTARALEIDDSSNLIDWKADDSFLLENNGYSLSVIWSTTDELIAELKTLREDLAVAISRFMYLESFFSSCYQIEKDCHEYIASSDSNKVTFETILSECERLCTRTVGSSSASSECTIKPSRGDVAKLCEHIESLGIGLSGKYTEIRGKRGMLYSTYEGTDEVKWENRDDYAEEFNTVAEALKSLASEYLDSLDSSIVANMEAVNVTIEKRYEFIEKFRNAFWIGEATDQDDSSASNSLLLNVQTTNRPYKTCILYAPEVTEDTTSPYLEGKEARNKPAKWQATGGSEILIDDITFATFKPSATEDGDAAWGRAVNSIGRVNVKPPYLIAVANSRARTIPTFNRNSGSEYHRLDGFKGKATDFFGVHMVLKPMQIDFLSWTPMIGLYDYNTPNGVTKSFTTYSDIPGLLTLRVKNGIGPFETCRFGRTKFEIFKHPNYQETDMNTPRYINGTQEQDYYYNASTGKWGDDGFYRNYRVVNDEGSQPCGSHQYLEIESPMKGTITIQDHSGTTASISVNAAMEFSVLGKKVLTSFIAGIGEEEDTTESFTVISGTIIDKYHPKDEDGVISSNAVKKRTCGLVLSVGISDATFFLFHLKWNKSKSKWMHPLSSIVSAGGDGFIPLEKQKSNADEPGTVNLPWINEDEPSDKAAPGGNFFALDAHISKEAKKWGCQSLEEDDGNGGANTKVNTGKQSSNVGAFYETDTSDVIIWDNVFAVAKAPSGSCALSQVYSLYPPNVLCHLEQVHNDRGILTEIRLWIGVDNIDSLKNDNKYLYYLPIKKAWVDVAILNKRAVSEGRVTNMWFYVSRVLYSQDDVQDEANPDYNGTITMFEYNEQNGKLGRYTNILSYSQAGESIVDYIGYRPCWGYLLREDGSNGKKYYSDNSAKMHWEFDEDYNKEITGYEAGVANWNADAEDGRAWRIAVNFTDCLGITHTYIKRPHWYVDTPKVEDGRPKPSNHSRYWFDGDMEDYQF